MDATNDYKNDSGGIFSRSYRIGSISFHADILILALVAIPLRLIGLGNETLWYDEGFTWYLAHLDIPLQVIRATLGDVHPPLWYLLEWLIVHTIGASEWMLRLPSAILGIVAVFLLYRLCIVFSLHRRVALLSSLLASVLAGPLYYSQEARVYSLLVVAVLWMIQSGKEQRWIQFTIAMALTAYSQNLGLIYCAVIGFLYIWHYRNLKPLVASIVAAFLWLPWSVGMAVQIQNINGGFWTTPIDLGWWLNAIPTMTFGWRLDGPLMALLYPVSFAVTIGALIVAWAWLQTSTGRIIAVAMIVPPMFAGFVSVAWHPIFIARAFLPSIFLLMISWSLLILDKNKQKPVLVALIPALVVSGLTTYFPLQGGRGNIKAMLSPIREQWQAGDVIYYPSNAEAILSAYYLPSLPYRLNTDSGDLNQMLSMQAKKDFGFEMARFSDLKSQGFARAWIVANATGGTNSDTLAFLGSLQGKGTLISHKDYVEIWLLNL